MLWYVNYINRPYSREVYIGYYNDELYKDKKDHYSCGKATIEMDYTLYLRLGFSYSISNYNFSIDEDKTINEQSMLNLYDAFLNYHNFDQYEEEPTTEFILSEPSKTSYQYCIDLVVDDWNLPLNHPEYDNPSKYIPLTTRVEIFYSLLTSYPVITSTQKYIYLGDTETDYSFDFKQKDIDNLFKTNFDETEIIGFTSIDKSKGILRIGYKWYSTDNSKEWDIPKLNDEVMSRFIFSCEYSGMGAMFTYKFSKDTQYNYLYYDFDYTTDPNTIYYFRYFLQYKDLHN